MNIMNDKIKCPCCGEHTIEKDSIYNICENWFWEYGPIQNDKSDYAGGANCHLLNEYRKEFERKKKILTFVVKMKKIKNIWLIGIIANKGVYYWFRYWIQM